MDIVSLAERMISHANEILAESKMLRQSAMDLLTQEREAIQDRMLMQLRNDLAGIDAALLHIGGASMAQCEECGKAFLITDKRQRFCPAPKGKESRCALRARARQRRLKEGPE